MKDSLKYILVLIVFLIIPGVLFFYSKNSNIFTFEKTLWLIFIIVAFVILIAFAIFIIYIKNLNKKDAKMYNIAIIGLPKAGKTTFVSTMVAAMQYGRIKLNGYKPVFNDNATIDRIEENLSRLEKGEPIGSTDDNTLFLFRFEIREDDTYKLRPRKEFQIGIGDFQGQMTEKFIDEKTNIWKQDSDFFNWVKKANAFIFTVDLGYYLLDKKNYIPEITKSLKSAWQKIVKLNDNQINEILKKPVVLLFNKEDILSRNFTPSQIDKMAFSENQIFHGVRYSEIDVSMKKEIIYDFHNLISFFNTYCKNFSFNFNSSIASLDRNEYYEEFSYICNHIFPFNVNRNRNQLNNKKNEDEIENKDNMIYQLAKEKQDLAKKIQELESKIILTQNVYENKQTEENTIKDQIISGLEDQKKELENTIQNLESKIQTLEVPENINIEEDSNSKYKIAEDFGFLYIFQGKYDEAIQSFQKAIEINIDNAMAYYGMGVAYQKSGNQAKANDCFQQHEMLKKKNNMNG